MLVVCRKSLLTRDGTIRRHRIIHLGERTEVMGRLSIVLRQVLQVQRRGERLSDSAIAGCLEQFTHVDADQARMEERLRQFWTPLDKERSH